MDARAPEFTPKQENKAPASSPKLADLVWQDVTKDIKQKNPETPLGKKSAEEAFGKHPNTILPSSRRASYGLHHELEGRTRMSEYEERFIREDAREDLLAVHDLKDVLEDSGAFQTGVPDKKRRDSAFAPAQMRQSFQSQRGVSSQPVFPPGLAVGAPLHQTVNEQCRGRGRGRGRGRARGRRRFVG